MGWLGKIIGAGIGSRWGKVGAIVGAVIGHYLIDRQDKNEKPVEKPANDDALLILCGSIFYELSTLDGPAPSKVRKAALSILSEMNEMCGLNVETGRLNSFFSSGMVYQPKRKLIELSDRLGDNFKYHFYGWLIRISVADGVQSEVEKRYIQDFLDAFQIDRQISEFISRLYLYPAARKGSAPGVAEAAELLKVSPTATLSEIKRAYRKQCMIYHPDHLGNVAPEIRALASEQFEKITQAYDLLSGLSGGSGETLWALDSEREYPVCVKPGMVIRCICCGAKIRIPDPFNPARARCPKCQSLLAFEKEFIHNWMEIHRKS